MSLSYISPKTHPSITINRVMDAIEESHLDCSNPGFCTNCGAETDGVEPDAEKGRCDQCRLASVYGAEQLLLIMVF